MKEKPSTAMPSTPSKTNGQVWSNAWAQKTTPIKPSTIATAKTTAWQQSQPQTLHAHAYHSSNSRVQTPSKQEPTFPVLGGKKGDDTEFPSLSSTTQSNTTHSRYSSVDELSGQFSQTNIDDKPSIIKKQNTTKESIGSTSRKISMDYGLGGLLDIIRNPESSIATLSLGIDLSTLGLDLTAGESLYVSFVSPWGDASRRVDQLLPSCYHLPHSPPPIQQRIGQFQDDTLFYLFYNHTTPTQHIEAVAKELCRRGWRWFKDWNVWIHPNLLGHKDVSFSCIVFDPIRWEHVRKDLPPDVIRGDGLLALD